jgi:hypothetical protein
MKLNFGFESFPYAARYSAKSPLTAATKKRRPKQLSAAQQAYGQGKTTQQVAKDLENQYGIVEKFYEMEEDNIVDLVEEAFDEAIEKVMMMQRISKKGISDASTNKIEERFRKNLAERRYDGMLPGVPTLASLRGVSHLLQHPYAKRGSRPSFIDTGMYSRSFRAWVTED